VLFIALILMPFILLCIIAYCNVDMLFNVLCNFALVLVWFYRLLHMVLYRLLYDIGLCVVIYAYISVFHLFYGAIGLVYHQCSQF